MIKNKKTKILLIFLGIIISLLILKLSLYCASNYIWDATVNVENGNISILKNDFFIDTYSSDGTLIYSTELKYNSGGYAYLDYVDGLLYVKILRHDIVIVLDDNGNIIKKEPYYMTQTDKCWNENWKKKSTRYFFENDSTIYCYDAQNFINVAFLKKEKTLEIIKESNENKVIIWSSNK